MNKIKKSKSIFKADKSSFLYNISPSKYALHKEVIKHYKKAPANLEVELNKEASILANKFNLENRIEKINIKNCFITLKDHKNNFYNNPEC